MKKSKQAQRIALVLALLIMGCWEVNGPLALVGNACFGAGFNLVPESTPVSIFGPKEVLRVAGPPTIGEWEIDPAARTQFQDSFTMTVTPLGNPARSVRGDVLIDGSAVASKADFAKADGIEFDVPVALGPESVLKVEVASRPGDTIRVEIKGFLKPVSSVVVSPGEAFLAPGDARQFTAVPYASDGTQLLDRQILWTSEDGSVAAVSLTGIVTAVGSGETSVKAMVDEVGGETVIHVLGPPTIPIPFRGLYTGGFHACGIGLDGTNYCWGLNRNGQVGDGTLIDRFQPTPLATAERFVSFSLGADYSCGLTEDGRAFCWGWNDRGQLGNGSENDSSTPVPVATAVRFKSLHAGYYHACGLTGDGAAYCWGPNWNGQLGEAPWGVYRQPIPVYQDYRFVSLTLGPAHTCGLQADGKALCWRSNGYPEPREPEGGHRYRQLSAGDNNNMVCGITLSGKPLCWGWNFWGQLGDGTTEDRSVPTPVKTELQFTQIDMGECHACGLDLQGKAHCWGLGDQGQLGIGELVTRVLEPAETLGGIPFTSLHLGGYYSGALTAGGGAYMWGHNWAGQLGIAGVWIKPKP